ncbi:MAG: hypothetical protein BWX51_01896 [Bacteroidetes bacterium ADurb.Bin012]|jgi:hypothetical protein|nr:MAG: hypothetical protein BWX51_01896 [Bacteroidetes bacterium ADurb.Bin012]
MLQRQEFKKMEPEISFKPFYLKIHGNPNISNRKLTNKILNINYL